MADCRTGEAAIAPWERERTVHEMREFSRREHPDLRPFRGEERWRVQLAGAVTMVAQRQGWSLAPAIFLARIEEIDSPREPSRLARALAGEYDVAGDRFHLGVRSLDPALAVDWWQICRSLEQGLPLVVLAGGEVTVGYRAAWWWAPEAAPLREEGPPSMVWLYSVDPDLTSARRRHVFEESRKDGGGRIDALFELTFRKLDPSPPEDAETGREGLGKRFQERPQ